MATCALLGQAVGTAVWYAVENKCSTNRETAQKYAKAIQQTLLDDDCTLPGFRREISELCRKSALSSSNGACPEALRNGIDRVMGEEKNSWTCRAGESVEYSLPEKTFVSEIRLAFDSDLSRDHLNMVSNYTLVPALYTPPETLVQGFHVEIDGEVIHTEKENHSRFVVLPCNRKCSSVKLVIDALAPGREAAQLFRFDFR